MGYPHDKLRIVLFIAALVGLIVLAASLGDLKFAPGKPFPFSIFTSAFSLAPGPAASSTSESGGLLLFTMLFFWLGLPLAILYMFITAQGRRRLLRMLPTFIILLFLLNWLGNQSFEPRASEGEELGLGSFGAPGTSLPPLPGYISEPSAWLLLAVNVSVAVIFVTAIFFVWRWYQRQQQDPQEQIVQHAEQALADLQAGQDLRNIILRCYAHMSQVLQQEQDIKRRQGMTAREFERQLADIGLNSSHIQRLTRLFEQVRYSPNSLSWQEEDEAVACLNAIVEAYGASS